MGRKSSKTDTHVDETNSLYAAVFHLASIFPKDDTCSGLHCEGVSMRRGRSHEGRTRRTNWKVVHTIQVSDKTLGETMGDQKAYCPNGFICWGENLEEVILEDARRGDVMNQGVGTSF